MKLRYALLPLALACCHAASAQAPAGSTGQCKDGTYTNAASKAGACSGHKGVQTWFAAAATPAPAAKPAAAAKAAAAPAPVVAAKPAAAPKPAPAPAAAPSGAMPAGATGQCKDGTYTNAASKAGACSGHKGVQTWLAGAAPAAAPKPAAMPAPVSAPTPVAAPKPAPAAAPAPRPMPAPAAAPAAGGGPGTVWVNTSTKVYHCSGDRFYGKTKEGKYMTEAAAKAMGARPDKNSTACSK